MYMSIDNLTLREIYMIEISFYIVDAMPKNISHPLSNDDTQRIQRNWSFLKQNLEQNEIRDTFIDNGVWDVSDCDEIDAGKTSEEKNEVFLKLLLDSGPKAYEIFKKALHKTNSTYIIEELEKTQLLKDDTDHLVSILKFYF